MKQEAELLSYLSAMVASSDDAILAKTPEGIITFWNRGAEQLYGYTAAEVLGKSVAVIIPDELSGELAELLGRLRQEIPIQHYETVRIAKDGRRLDVSLTMSPIRDAEGRLIGASTIARDVTERKRAEKALRQLSALVESSLDAIIGESLDGVITSWNQGAERLFGFSSAEAVSASLGIVIPEERRHELPDTLARIRGGRPLEQFETVRRRKDGSRFHASITVSPIHDEQGQLAGASVIARDISERKRMELELVQAKEATERALTQLEVTLDNISEGVLVAARDERPLLLNPSFRQSYGFPVGLPDQYEDLCRHVEKFDLNGAPISPEDWPLRLALRGQEVKQRELRVLRKDNGEEKIVSHSAVPVFDSNGQVIMAVMTTEDVTEHKALQERLYQAEKLEAIGQLAGGIAHDMNNYLGCVLLQAGLLRVRLGENSELTGYCKEIEDVCDQARSVVRQLLAFARRSYGMTIVVDVNQSVSSTLAMLRRLIGQGIEMTWQLEEPGWQIKTSPGHLSAILMNLAVNARDAMPEGGELSIWTRNTTLTQSLSLADVVVEAGQYVVLGVKDTGTGISAEHLARIFEPFFTTKPQGLGTGLGLSTVYGAAREMGGYVHVETRLGAGTTFEVWMPRCVEPQELPPAAPENRGARQLKSGKVLIVEDEPIVREAMTYYLKSCGLEVTAVASAPEALALIDADRDRFKTVLTDMVMPGMSGRNLAQQVLREVPEMRVILMSGYDEEQSTADLDPRVEFLAKPFEIRELSEMLGGHQVNRKRAAAEETAKKR
jgi:PAS domain S-box-containing protein